MPPKKFKHHSWTSKEEEVISKALGEGLMPNQIWKQKFPDLSQTSVKAKVERMKKDLEKNPSSKGESFICLD